MNLGTLVMYIGINALILSAVVIFLLKKSKSHWMTYIQTFCGALFLFSGWVKAVDPLGTAYKMEQYFDEFHYTFADTAISFIAPLFPLLSSYSITFSVVMIVFELFLGINLLTGAFKKFTAWAFFLLTIFFTVLTGFTYLTGYVPSGTNFFAFGQWGAYNENNMRVTDCGCFGDFIKLKPMVTFMKDIFLLIPSILFILFNDKFFQLFSPGIRKTLGWAMLVGSLIYCFSNYVWDIPHVDFRPFKEGADVAAQYNAEQEASSNVKVTAFKIQKPGSSEVVELSYDVFMKEWGSKYKPEGYEVVEQVKTKPSIPLTKISDFEFVDGEGYPVSEDLLNKEGTTLMLVSYTLKGEFGEREATVMDTVYQMDTIQIEDTDSISIVKSISEINEKQVMEGYYDWEDSFEEDYSEIVRPIANAALKSGADVIGVIGAGQEKLASFKKDLDLAFPLYEADDILLKTIVRSNPGFVLWKDGVIVKKWHVNKVPNWDEIQKYL